MAAPRLAELAARLPAIIELTRRLVELESPTDAPDGVAAVAEALAAPLAAAGCAVRLVPVADAGPLLDAELVLGDGPTVLVLGHGDTVWPRDTLAGWPFAEADGWLTGPGVGDMKCCLATAVEAIALLARERPPGLGRVRLMLVPDEERGSTGSRPAIEAAARDAAACLTLEAARPGGGIVTARGAVGAMRVTAQGTARHVTDPGPHASALVPLAALVAPIEALAGASVGVLRGGTARQVVPGSAELHVDLRGTTSAAVEGLAAAVRALAHAAPRADGVAVAVEGGLTRPAWPSGPAAERLLAEAAALAAPLGLELHAVVERGGSDASFAGALGVPTLDGLGPPCHGSCSPAERVPVDGIAPWGALLAGLIAAAPGAVG